MEKVGGLMLSSYPNYSCTIYLRNSLNEQGEQQIYEITTNPLDVFLSLEGQNIQTSRGWIRAYDALGYVAEKNAEDYVPHIGDKWIFTDGTEYEITHAKPLRGMGQTHYGFRCELKTLSESGMTV